MPTSFCMLAPQLRSRPRVDQEKEESVRQLDIVELLAESVDLSDTV